MNLELIIYAYAVFGLIIGSFLNVCIYRIPLGKSIVFPGSGCPHCSKSIRFYDNIPVLSYLLLRGKCRSCREPISIQYPIVELLTALAFYACARTWNFAATNFRKLPFSCGRDHPHLHGLQSSHSSECSDASGNCRRNSPEPIPKASCRPAAVPTIPTNCPLKLPA